MIRIRIYPYKQGSKSAKVLSALVGGAVLKHAGSKYRPRKGDIVVNWGSAKKLDFGPAAILNPDVTSAQCKLASFKKFKEGGVNVPAFWTNKDEIPDDAFPICCRTVLRGHSGAGLTIANARDELVDAPLYTKYVKKKDEYRLHVWGEKVFFIQRKARKLDVENPNWQVRNLAGGFSFVEAEQADVNKDVIDQSIMALKTLGLDFGGVDVAWNDKEQKAYVLEVNTACGLEERTGAKYAEQLQNLK